MEQHRLDSHAILKEWARSVLRETAVWAIQSQLEPGDKSNEIRFKSIEAAQQLCRHFAFVWASKLALQGLTVAAETIRKVAAEGSDNLYLKDAPASAMRASSDDLPFSTTSNQNDVRLAPQSIAISNPIRRWSMINALKRDMADETLDCLVDNPNHKTMLHRLSQRSAVKKHAVAIATSDHEKIIVRKRKSHNLKRRTVQGPRPLGRPKKSTHFDSAIPQITPRLPLDPQEAYQGAKLGPVEKYELDITMFHAEQTNETMPRVIGALAHDTTKQLPHRLQGPVILEANGNILILPSVRLKWQNDPTKEIDVGLSVNKHAGPAKEDELSPV